MQFRVNRLGISSSTWFIQNVIIFFYIFAFYYSINCKSYRRKRLLHFPEKTNVVITMSLLKLFPSESIINTLTEYDVLFPVPLHPYGTHLRTKRHIERNVIRKKFEEVMDILGFDEKCYIEMIYRLKHEFLGEKSNETDNLMRDILDVLFISPPGMNYEKFSIFNDSCSNIIY